MSEAIRSYRDALLREWSRSLRRRFGDADAPRRLSTFMMLYTLVDVSAHM